MYTQVRVAYRFAILVIALAWALDSVAATSDDEKQLAILTAGRHLLEEHKPALAISAHFDKVIRHYETRYRHSKNRIYCARTPEEALYYSLMAAAGPEGDGKSSTITVIDSIWSDAYFLKGYALVELKHPQEARKYLERALALSPMNSAYLSESAHIDQMDRDWEAALGKFRMATEAAESLTPEDGRIFEWTRALRGQGFALIELGRLEEAKAMYRKALELNPDDEGSKGELRYIERMQANLAAESEPFVENPDWVITARLAFVERDRLAARPRMPQGDFRLWFPWIGGDLYGAPTTNDFIEPVLDADYKFTIDLNRSRQHLIRSLDTARFADSGLIAEPADVRIARVATFTMKPDLSGRAGFTSWMDSGATSDGYMLVYFDRACRVAGTVRLGDNGGVRKYDLVVPGAGYYWLRTRNLGEAQQETTVGNKPADLVLAIEPLND